MCAFTLIPQQKMANIRRYLPDALIPSLENMHQSISERPEENVREEPVYNSIPQNHAPAEKVN